MNLRYRKVYIVPCKKEKTLIPAHIFNKNYLSDLYRLCHHTEKTGTLLYRKVRPMEAYLVESLPRSFTTFLTTRYQSICIVNSAYSFIINSLSSTLINREHLFVDIQDRYFDILLTRNNEVLLFNSFSYNSVTDMVYYMLNCLKNTNTIKQFTNHDFRNFSQRSPSLRDVEYLYSYHICIKRYQSQSNIKK